MVYGFATNSIATAYRYVSFVERFATSCYTYLSCILLCARFPVLSVIFFYFIRDYQHLKPDDRVNELSSSVKKYNFLFFSRQRYYSKTRIVKNKN